MTALSDPDRLARRAIARFLIGCVVALGIVSLATLAVASELASHEARHEAEVRGEGFSTSMAAPLVSSAVREQRPRAMQNFALVMHNRLTMGGIAHIKVFDATGRVIWADQTGLLGRTFELPPDVQGRAGQTFTISSSSNHGHVANEGDQPSDHNLLEVYVGTTAADGQPVIIETYWTRRAIDTQYDFFLRLVAPLSLGALAVLIVTVVPLGLSLARGLAQSARERDQMFHHAVRASELERRRLSQTLHDGVIQDLAGLAYVLPTVTRRLPEDGAQTEALRSALDDATDLIKDDVAQLRGIVGDIYPPSLDAEGLEPALRQLAGWAERNGVLMSVRVDDADDLDRPRRRLAYRVVREGLLNVVRHAGAEQAEVSVVRSAEGDLRVSIRDDGHNGVARIPDSDSGHLGLRILHDVLVDLGGDLELRGRSGGGTELEASLPAHGGGIDELEPLLPS